LRASSIGLYLYWYLAECIRDSGTGGLRAPETIGSAPGLDDMFWQTLLITACLVIFLGPWLVYHLIVRQTDTTFWCVFSVGLFVFPMGLLSVVNTTFWCVFGVGLFVFPMGLLSVVMFDSLTGLNPFIIIRSILSSFFPYCAMVALFALMGLLLYAGARAAEQSAVLGAIVFLVRMYLLLVGSHLLGRFYFRYQEKLNWDV